MAVAQSQPNANSPCSFGKHLYGSDGKETVLRLAADDLIAFAGKVGSILSN